MKHTLIALLLPLSFMASAQAAEPTTGKPYRLVGGVGLTIGGDKLATTYYTDNTSSDIRAGSGLHMLAGIEYRPNAQFSVQATVGYHIHVTPEASNGDADFNRMPIELLAYYHINEKWRVGAGIRHTLSPKLDGSGAASNLNVDFEDSTGFVLEAEYFYSPQLGFKLRGVSEKFKVKGLPNKASGNHLGMYMNYYF